MNETRADLKHRIRQHLQHFKGCYFIEVLDGNSTPSHIALELSFMSPHYKTVPIGLDDLGHLTFISFVPVDSVDQFIEVIKTESARAYLNREGHTYRTMYERLLLMGWIG